MKKKFPIIVWRRIKSWSYKENLVFESVFNILMYFLYKNSDHVFVIIIIIDMSYAEPHLEILRLEVKIIFHHIFF